MRPSPLVSAARAGARWLATLAVVGGAVGPAIAEEPAAAEAPPAEPPAELPPEVIAEAVPAAPLTAAGLRWLEPKRGQLGQNPYGITDYTAYTLEFGEWRLGLGSISVGALPRTQVGFSPPLTALGILNGTAKVNLLRLGPVDLAASGQLYRLGVGGFRGQQLGGGGVLSVQVLPPWSLHLSGLYSGFSASGLPDLSDPPTLLGLVAPDLAGYQPQVEGVVGDAPLDFSARSFSLRLATDVRFNRRDSLIVQAQGMVWSQVDSATNPDDLPPLMNLDKALGGSSDAPLRDSYVASAAWQFSWKHADLRIGAGVSSVPGAWLLQSTELAWRLGGATRNSERRMRRTWRSNREAALQGAPLPPPRPGEQP